MGVEEEELVKEARRGNDEAFTVLIHQRKGMLYRTAFSYVKSREDALDIVSATVCKAYISLKKLKEPAYFETWLTRILINCSLDFLQKRRRETLAAAPEPGLALTEDPAAHLDLRRAVDELEDKCRTVIILKYFNDLTLREVAEVMQCPQGTVKTYLHRALASLRLNLKEDWQNA